MKLITKFKLSIIALGIMFTVSISNAGRPTPVKDTNFNKKDVECLANNIYMESRGESFRGQIAVAQVVVNRLHAKKYGNSICEIIYAKNQFSWTEDYVSGNKNYKLWKNSLVISRAVLSGELRLPKFNAKYFHNKTVKPQWAKNKQLVATIGNHYFYT
jgi:spore germination cell wall hydrolase CwlJ-like protein